MVDREYGYKKTLVSGTEFAIKEKFEGTGLSTVGRRLAARGDVREVTVEHDGTIRSSFKRDDHWNMADVTPDGFTIIDGMVHPSNRGNSAAMLKFERSD